MSCLRSHRSLRIETLEGRRVLTATSFVAHTIAEFDLGVADVSVADVDSDGDLDIAASGSDFLLWLENGEDDSAFVEHSLSDVRVPAFQVSDVDQDGDADILLGSVGAFDSPQGADLNWIENNGSEVFAAAETLASTDYYVISEIELADINGDQNPDILVGTGGGLGGGDITLLLSAEDGQYDSVVVEPGFETIETINAFDIDGDGDQDVLASYGSDFPFGYVAWYEQLEGQEFKRHKISSDEAWHSHLVTTDFDGDGDLDILKARQGSLAEDYSGGHLEWHENLGEGAFSEARTLLSVEDLILATDAADLDLDGDVDFVVSYQDRVVIHSSNGDGTFEAQEPLSHGRAHTLELLDFDLDGDVDMLFPSRTSDNQQQLTLLENRLAGDINDDGEVAFDDFLVLSNNFGATVEAGESGDFDGDGQVTFADFLTLSDNYGAKRESSNTNTEPTVDNRPLEERLIGMQRTAAFQLAEDEGRPVRISSVDGVPFPLTLDFVANRINLDIEDSLVVRVWMG